MPTSVADPEHFGTDPDPDHCYNNFVVVAENVEGIWMIRNDADPDHGQTIYIFLFNFNVIF